VAATRSGELPVAQVVEEVAPVMMIALPLPVEAMDPPLVALATLVTDTIVEE